MQGIKSPLFFFFSCRIITQLLSALPPTMAAAMLAQTRQPINVGGLPSALPSRGS